MTYKCPLLHKDNIDLQRTIIVPLKQRSNDLRSGFLKKLDFWILHSQKPIIGHTCVLHCMMIDFDLQRSIIAIMKQKSNDLRSGILKK